MKFGDYRKMNEMAVAAKDFKGKTLKDVADEFEKKFDAKIKAKKYREGSFGIAIELDFPFAWQDDQKEICKILVDKYKKAGWSKVECEDTTAGEKIELYLKK
jgi:hypothetical protein